MTAAGYLVILTAALSAAAHADSYLDMLEAEANGPADSSRHSSPASDNRINSVRTTVTPQTNYIDPAMLARTKPASRKHVQPGLNQLNFERTLRTRFIGVYRKYEQLGTPDRNEVYAAYTQDNSIRKIRKTILHLKLESLTSGRQPTQ